MEINNLEVVLGTFLALTPVVVGLVAVVKPFVTDRFAALASIAIGIVIAYLGALIVGIASWPVVVLGGLVLGLSAAGLYSGTRATVQG